ncbi:MAG: phosphoribosyl-ATP diphosphatase [Rhodospirillaceae bacterium]
MTSPNRPSAEVLDQLFAVIESRKGADPATSYTAKLFDRGRGKIVQKMGEESFECAVAALSEGPDALTAESADLLYHLLVLWADAGLAPEAVWQELAGRFGISGIVEKASRSQN